MKVRERMAERPVVCRVDESLDAAAARMKQCELGALPVLDRDGAVAGMLRDRDIALAALRKRRALHELRVGDALSGELVVCGPEDDLWLAAEIMREARAWHLPVIGREKELVGVITLADLARHTSSGPAREREDLGMDDVLELLVSFGRRRVVRETAPVLVPLVQEPVVAKPVEPTLVAS